MIHREIHVSPRKGLRALDLTLMSAFNSLTMFLPPTIPLCRFLVNILSQFLLVSWLIQAPYFVPSSHFPLPHPLHHAHVGCWGSEGVGVNVHVGGALMCCI